MSASSGSVPSLPGTLGRCISGTAPRPPRCGPPQAHRQLVVERGVDVRVVALDHAPVDADGPVERAQGHVAARVGALAGAVAGVGHEQLQVDVPRDAGAVGRVVEGDDGEVVAAPVAHRGLLHRHRVAQAAEQPGDARGRRQRRRDAVVPRRRPGEVEGGEGAVGRREPPLEPAAREQREGRAGEEQGGHEIAQRGLHGNLLNGFAPGPGGNGDNGAAGRFTGTS